MNYSRILRPKEVRKLTGLSRSGMYRAIERGTFPRGFKISGTRMIGFDETEIAHWIGAQKLRVR